MLPAIAASQLNPLSVFLNYEVSPHNNKDDRNVSCQLSETSVVNFQNSLSSLLPFISSIYVIAYFLDLPSEYNNISFFFQILDIDIEMYQPI